MRLEEGWGNREFLISIALLFSIVSFVIVLNSGFVQALPICGPPPPPDFCPPGERRACGSNGDWYCIDTCGDGSCNFGETSSSCPADCPTVCGNGICETGENSNNCPQDCPVQSACGDGIVDPGEQCDTGNLNGQSCQSLGYTGGTLGCTSSCTFNTNQCFNNPKGSHDSSTCTVSTGWTCDADNYNQSLNVEIYRDGAKGSGGVLLGTATANLDGGSAVSSECGGNPNHAFTFNTPASLNDGSNHSIYIYGINIGSGSDALLLNSPKIINCVPPPPVCVLNSASWSVNQTVEGNVVNLGVTTTNCQGEALSFVVLERDFLGTDDPVNINPPNIAIALDGGTTFSSWTAEWQKDTDASFQSDPPEYYFRATLVSTGENIQSSLPDLKVFQVAPNICENVVTCADYGNQNDCEADICAVTDDSVPSTVDCNDPDTTCACAWNTNTSSCISSVSYTNNTNIGTCYYTEETTDTCEDDGYLTVNLIATWVWDSECSNSACQAENQEQQAACQSTTEVFQCPAQIPLPFFTFYNLLAAVILIAIIYWAISLKKKGKRARRKR